MANIPSAKKRMRQNIKRRERNRTHRSCMRSAIRKLRARIEAGDAESARTLLPDTLSLIDSTVTKGVLHRNTAARYKSRLTKAVQSMAS
jgi:small subunit ribosomal protein S20